jgi:Ricin-type beta-trefoil lectin domain/Ricin-type beta-trefoil lectin domain-like
MAVVMARRSVLAGLVLALLVPLSVGVGSASADPLPAATDVLSAEANEYRKDFDVPLAQAKGALAVQDTANEAEVVPGLEDRLDARYAGIWFDNASGEYVVPLLPGAGGAAVASEFAGADLGADEFRTSPAQFSWDELEAAQMDLDKALLPLIEEGMVQTSLNPRINSVVVTLAGGMSAEAEGQARGLAADSPVAVEVRTSDEADLTSSPEACTDPFCDAPLRGGVEIYPPFTKEKECTASFPAVGPNGNRYLLTAGHCVHQNFETAPTYLNWMSKDSALVAHSIGAVEQWGSGGSTEWAKIKANGSWWDSGAWPAQIAYWGAPKINKENHVEGKGSPVDLNYSITGQGTNVVGGFACRSGIKTGSSCGTITALNVTQNSTGGPIYNLVEIQGSTLCSNFGDSGSPYFTGHSALGIHVTSANQSQTCGDALYYADINLATAALNVAVAPPAPKVTATASALNGNPGWATVSGQVTSGGMAIDGKTVNVKLFKWENNDWVLKTNPPLQVPVSNGSYSLSEWEGVGPGSWIAQTVFPAQGPFGEGASSTVTEGAFTVKNGFRLLSKPSSKCIDITNGSRDNLASLQQWDCMEVNSHQNQVFTLVPRGGGYYQIKNRLSGRCLDVYNASTSDGAGVVQYTCGTQANQSWQLINAGAGYFELKAQHSNKCLDVPGGSSTAGVLLQQWTCNGAAQQKWSAQSVEASAIPTEVGLTVPEGERLYGEYGYVSGQGYVKSGAYGVGGQKVRINYEKLEGGSYKLKTFTEPTLNSEGFYQWRYMGVGPGEWRMNTQYFGSGQLAGSASPNYVNFHIGVGYRFVFRHSSKCLTLNENKNVNGQALIQWSCFDPNPGFGQVLTMVPFDNGSYFELKINSTNKCIDVTNGSGADGAWLQQWECLGANQANQLWQIVPIAGQPNWFAALAKHSGKCMDVTGGSTADGPRIQQWSCSWNPQEQWAFQGIG